MTYQDFGSCEYFLFEFKSKQFFSMSKINVLLCMKLKKLDKNKTAMYSFELGSFIHIQHAQIIIRIMNP
jgi:hypothetical protein